MKSALAILGETGRTDFTVLEVVERSKTSLRSFYQHFSTKDELLLALIDKIMSESTRQWRDDTTGLPAVAALRVLIDRICTPAQTSKQDMVNRGLTYYNDHLAESLPRADTREARGTRSCRVRDRKRRWHPRQNRRAREIPATCRRRCCRRRPARRET